MSQLAVELASCLMATAYPAVVPALLSTYQVCLWFIGDKTSDWVGQFFGLIKVIRR